MCLVCTAIVAIAACVDAVDAVNAYVVALVDSACVNAPGKLGLHRCITLTINRSSLCCMFVQHGLLVLVAAGGSIGLPGPARYEPKRPR